MDETRTVEEMGEGKSMRHHTEYDSEDYDDYRPMAKPDGEDCQLPYEDWQMNVTFPTCNNLPETDMIRQVFQHDNFFLGHGSYRTVFLLEGYYDMKQQQPEDIVLKVMNINQDWDENCIDRHCRDALISERLTRSPYVLDIYGYCADSALYEYASAGSLYGCRGGSGMDR